MTKQGEFESNYSQTLVDLFFREQDAILMEEYHRLAKMKETKAALSKVSGIANDKILQKLVDLVIRPELAASLAMVPLIEVAWADGRVDEKEKAAVLAAAAQSYFAKNSVDYHLLEQWLEHRPPRRLLDAWTHYIQGLCETLTAAEKAVLKRELVGHARQIAKAAGGFMGLGSKISEAEQRTLDTLESVFD
jgi:hypothetical protein